MDLAMCLSAHAQPPPAPAGDPTPAATQHPAGTPGVATPGVATPGDTTDEGFIEFLGSDDVGDAAWWEFLKRAPAQGKNPPAPPPQDASK
jgi:hypothetical protein